MRPKWIQSEAGLTLIELLAAATISMFLISVIYSVFFNNMKIVDKITNEVELKEEGDIILAFFLKELNETDYDYIEKNGNTFTLKKIKYDLNKETDWIKATSFQNIKTIEVIDSNQLVVKENEEIKYSSELSNKIKVTDLKLEIKDGVTKNIIETSGENQINKQVFESGVFNLTITVQNSNNEQDKELSLVSQIGF